MAYIGKRTPRDNLSIGQIVKNKGYYDICNNWNSIMTFAQYPGLMFRGRVEVFIFDKNNNVYIDINPNTGKYRIPGGSIDKQNSCKRQVAIEAKEEARIILGKIEYTNYSYFTFFKKKYVDSAIHWDGIFNKVYIAKFKKWYYGYIDPSVQDYYIATYGEFIPYKDAVKYLTTNHKKALNLIPR